MKKDINGHLTHAFAGFCGAMLMLVCIAFADSDVAKDVGAAAGGLVSSAAAIAGVVIALRGVVIARLGVETWRHQLRGTAVFDSCFKVSEALTHWHRQFKALRSGLVLGRRG